MLNIKQFVVFIPEYAAKVAIPLQDAFGDSFIQGSVESLDIEGKKVVIEGGREIEFTHCVIAVGSLGTVPARSEMVGLIFCLFSWPFLTC